MSEKMLFQHFSTDLCNVGIIVNSWQMEVLPNLSLHDDIAALLY